MITDYYRLLQIYRITDYCVLSFVSITFFFDCFHVARFTQFLIVPLVSWFRFVALLLVLWLRSNTSTFSTPMLIGLFELAHPLSRLWLSLTISTDHSADGSHSFELNISDLSHQFVVAVDTSNTVVGGILTQTSSQDIKLHPCFFNSHHLSPAEMNQDVGDTGWREQSSRYCSCTGTSSFHMPKGSMPVKLDGHYFSLDLTSSCPTRQAPKTPS